MWKYEIICIFYFLIKITKMPLAFGLSASTSHMGCTLNLGNMGSKDDEKLDYQQPNTVPNSFPSDWRCLPQKFSMFSQCIWLLATSGHLSLAHMEREMLQNSWRTRTGLVCSMDQGSHFLMIQWWFSILEDWRNLWAIEKPCHLH